MSRNPSRIVLSVLVTLLVRAGLSGQVSIVPTEVQLPGTQPLEVAAPQSVTHCDNCHGDYAPAVEPWRNWAGGMMAQAGRDPIFWATTAIAERDFPGAGDFCVRCHSPTGWLSGHSTPTDGSALVAADAQGVECDVCHTMTNPDGSEHIGVQNAPFLARDGASPPQGYYGSGEYVVWNLNAKLGPYANAVANHQTYASSFHRSSEFCGTCHDVSNPVTGDLAPMNGAHVPLAAGTFSGQLGTAVTTKAAFNNPPYAYGAVERTFSEHMASAFPTFKVSDYATLPAELQAGSIAAARTAALTASSGATVDYVSATRYYTCQTCHLKPVYGQGCDKNPPYRIDLPLHDMTGGNTWMPDVLLYLDGLNKLVMGGGYSNDQIAALAAGKLRARQNLQSAAALEVQGNLLRVVNLTGHKLISGYPEGRRMWLEMKWYDDQGNLVRSDGAYGPMRVRVDGQPVWVDTILDLEGTNTRIYEAVCGISQGWAAQLVSLGYPPTMALGYDRVLGNPEFTLGDVAAQAPGTSRHSFHFALNDTVMRDIRIPPYGMRRDEAQLRNCLPIPTDQYGDPPAGGVYDHFDELLLDPPEKAVSATIRLLYQATSWEYIQFLKLANDGSVAHLAATGDDLYDAWLATGMAAPEVMASAVWTRPVAAFEMRVKRIATWFQTASSGLVPRSTFAPGETVVIGARIVTTEGLDVDAAAVGFVIDRVGAEFTPVTLGATTDSSGRAQVSWTLPPGLDPGAYEVRVASVLKDPGNFLADLPGTAVVFRAR